MVDLPGDPWALDGPTYSASEARSVFGGLLHGAPTLGCAVVPQLPISANVSVGVGRVYIRDLLGGSYVVTVNTAQTIAIGSTGAQGRIDLVVARIYDQAAGDGVNKQTIEVIAGTPSGAPVPPSLPARCVALAEVFMPASTSTVGVGQITDRRVQLTLQSLAGRFSQRISYSTVGLPPGSEWFETDTSRMLIWNGATWRYAGDYVICTSATRPTDPLYEGLVINETNTDRQYIWTGSAWRLTFDSGPRHWWAGWGDSHYSWVIPSGNWNLAPGASMVIPGLKDCTYAITTVVTVWTINGSPPQNYRHAIAVNSAVMGENYMVGLPQNMACPLGFTAYYTPVADGNFTVTGLFAASSTVYASVQGFNYSTPFTTVVRIT